MFFEGLKQRSSKRVNIFPKLKHITSAFSSTLTRLVGVLFPPKFALKKFFASSTPISKIFHILQGDFI